jgi:hypothetical protein
MDKRRARLIAAAMVATFVVVRTTISVSPDSDMDIAGYNIHHLFTGLLLILGGGMPLALFPGRSRALDAAAAAFGAGLALALDEWVYLIATDGTNASYLLPVSLEGAIVMVTLAVVYIGVLYIVAGKRS